MGKLKRGDKHPTKNLIFYRYHSRIKTGEMWLIPEEFENQKRIHAISSMKIRRGNPIKSMVINARYKNRKYAQSKEEDLVTVEWVNEKLKEQDGKCYWFKVPLEIAFPNSSNVLPLKISLDRLDCSKGYTKENCVVCCFAANCGRGNASPEEWRKCIIIIKEFL